MPALVAQQARSQLTFRNEDSVAEGQARRVRPDQVLLNSNLPYSATRQSSRIAIPTDDELN
jgi:hypothetical protein